MIEVINRQRLKRVPVAELTELAAATLRAINKGRASLTVALVRDRLIRQLNREYRNKNAPTDVLSFPQRGQNPALTVAAGPRSRYLGDIVISTDTALRQAIECGHSFDRELCELLIHGILHLCGYDHETDHGQMNRLELRLRRDLLERRPRRAEHPTGLSGVAC